jgi:DNA-binding NtrC family response regulator
MTWAPLRKTHDDCQLRGTVGNTPRKWIVRPRKGAFNVRELENILERAVVIARGDTIETVDLPFSAVEENWSKNRNWKQGTLKNAMASLEQEMVRDAMAETGNHQTRAVRTLGISERMLRYKLKKYGFK